MTAYKAPVRDLQFVMHEMFDVTSHYNTIPEYAAIDKDLIDGIVEAAASFSESELSPLNRSGDEEGCTYVGDGVVTTPKGFKEAYAKFVELGYASLSANPEFGGQGLPSSLGNVVSEMLSTANIAWSIYSGLSHGAVRTIEDWGTDEQKQTFLPPLINGNWSGTMCLTEPHAGSDLGTIRTKAEPNADGTFSITGTKIFISAGEHDMTDNIVHIVLARLPGAPSGTKGISLFIVPKFNVDADGKITDRNTVKCGSIEHKMGINGNATCVMNFDGAKGYLIGAENKGLNCMFTFMNSARIGTAIQGVSAAEASFQGAIEYARERLAMRSVSGPKNPEKEADPIIVHPAIRNMLLTQKSLTEGGRALVQMLSMQLDIADTTKDAAARKEADDLLSLLTPIAKAFLTEAGCEAAKHGIQVYGGHGFIREWGMEQIARDTRIACLYEGTTEIQALDLLGRKVLGTQGEMLRKFTKIVHLFCEENKDVAGMAEFVGPLAKANKEWLDLTQRIGMKAMMNPDEAAAAAVDYLYYSGYVTLAYMWARMARVAKDAIAEGKSEGIYRSKIQTAQFYFSKILPRTLSHAATIDSGSETLMKMTADDFTY